MTRSTRASSSKNTLPRLESSPESSDTDTPAASSKLTVAQKLELHRQEMQCLEAAAAKEAEEEAERKERKEERRRKREQLRAQEAAAEALKVRGFFSLLLV